MKFIALFQALVAKLPNVHTVHERITAFYNLWLSIYTMLGKMGLAKGAQLTPEQAAAVLNSEFASAEARNAAPPPAPAAAPAPVAPAEDRANEPNDTDFMVASGLIK